MLLPAIQTACYEKRQKTRRQEINFTYDAFGRRISKSYGNREFLYIWDGNVPLHEWKEFDYKETTDNDRITWVFQGFIPTAKLVNGKSYSIISDHIGKPIQAIDDNGELVWSADYDIYGRLKNLKGERTFIPFRQAGQIEDAELEGLYYNRYRWYNSETGTYISQDPISIAGGLNVYAYVKDANRFVDVLGLADFIVTSQGTVVSTKKDINLVSTSDDGNWFQIHFEHEHDGLKPHTHYPEKNNRNTNRRYKKTDAVDLDYADKMLKEGKLRYRINRKDKGGCI